MGWNSIREAREKERKEKYDFFVNIVLDNWIMTSPKMESYEYDPAMGKFTFFTTSTIIGHKGNVIIDFFPKANKILNRATNKWTHRDGLQKLLLYVGHIDKDDILKMQRLKIGQTVSHEDYTSEDFKITDIDDQTGIVKTAGGKNGTWDNHVSLIIEK